MPTEAKAGASEYAAMVAEAEKSVAAVKDPELRRVAFEKILGTLLDGPRESGTGGRQQTKKNKKSKRAPAANKGGSSSSRQGPKGRVEALVDDDFFSEQRTIAEVKAKLANQGYHIALTSLSGPLQKLTQERRLRRQKAAASGKKSKATFVYANW